MKKLIAVLVFLILAVSISYIIISNKRETIWVCPKGETIRYIQTSEKPGKLYVETEKGNSRVFRAVYGPDKAEVLLTIPGKASPFIHPVQGYNPDEFLIYSSDGKSDKQYIHNVRTGKDTDIKSVKGISLFDMKQSVSPDGKWKVLSIYSEDDKRYRANIMNRQSGSITPLRGIDTSNSNEITWTPRGLMVFNGESGTLYKGDENGVKPIKQVGWSPFGFVTPDGDELITLSDTKNYGIELKRHDLVNNESVVIYKKFAKHNKEDDLINVVVWHNHQYSAYSDEITITMSWPRVRPVYIRDNRIAKAIPLRSKKELQSSSHGVAIWKPGVIAYPMGPEKKLPNRILTVKMD